MGEDNLDKFGIIKRSREEGRVESAKRYSFQSRERLRRSVETKIRTTMIGAISAIENKLGHLWGMGKPRNQLTDRELQVEALKDELRTEILNLGNNQIRAAVNEISQYEIKWNRYQYNVKSVVGSDYLEFTE